MLVSSSPKSTESLEFLNATQNPQAKAIIATETKLNLMPIQAPLPSFI